MKAASHSLYAIAAVLILLLFSPQARCATVAASTCNGSTVEQTRGPAYATQARQFLSELQQVVKSENKTKFAAMVAYPVLLIDSRGKSRVRAPATVVQRYSAIMAPEMRRVILGQSSACLFANDQGAMIGNGQIWFEQQANGEFKIITINLTAPEH